jgi:hypothetical protein
MILPANITEATAAIMIPQSIVHRRILYPADVSGWAPQNHLFFNTNSLEKSTVHIPQPH